MWVDNGDIGQKYLNFMSTQIVLKGWLNLICKKILLLPVWSESKIESYTLPS